MRIQVAATRRDWLDLFEKIDPAGNFKFYRREAYSHPDIVPLGINDLPNLGISKTGIMVQENSYLIDRFSNFRIRPQTVKGVKAYIVDGLLNQDAINFYHGGVFGEDFFMMGELTAQSELGKDGVRLFARAMQKWKRDTGIYFGDDCVSQMGERFFTFDFRYEKWKFFNE